jgi:hypothetical protein
MRIKVLQGQSGWMQESELSEQVNRYYCNKHGYEYIFHNEPWDEAVYNRAVFWNKVKFIKDNLHDCDYLVWLDCDAVFYGNELKIEEELLPLLGNRHVMMIIDCATESFSLRDDAPNVGVIVWRNSPESHKILDDWWNCVDGNANFRWQWPPEQSAWHVHIQPKYNEYVVMLKDYYVMNGHYGQYIRHFCGLDPRQRRVLAREVLKSQGIHAGRHIDILEIFTNSQCPKTCPKCNKLQSRKMFPGYQFTPQMARNLTEGLERHECGIGELAMVGGEPLLWKHFDEVIEIFKASPFIHRTRLTTALLDGYDMKKYEQNVDALYVSDYGFNRHLIEQKCQDREKYTVWDLSLHWFIPMYRHHGTVPVKCNCPSFWLFNDRFWYCTAVFDILNEAKHGFNDEEVAKYSCSIDDGLTGQNFFKLHGFAPACEACMLNPSIWNALNDRQYMGVLDGRRHAAHELQIANQRKIR